MAQSGYTPILIYASGTASAVPLAANMTSSASGAELALNYADGKLYYKNSAGAVTLLASAGGAITPLTNNGVVYVNSSGQATSGIALTFDGSKLAVGQASVTAGSVVQVNGALLASGVVTALDTTNLGVQIGGGGTVAAGGASTVAGIYADVNGFGGASDLIIRPRSDGTPGALRIYTGSGGGLERYKIQADGTAIWTIGSEQMRLTSTGLGIGTSSPGAKLDVKVGATNGSINFGRSATELELFVANGNDQYLGGTVAGSVGLRAATGSALFLGTQSTQSLVLETNSVARATIDSSGNVGIGTSSPGQKLHVDNSANSSTWIKVSNGSNGAGAAAGVLFGNDGGDLGAMSLLSSTNSSANSLFLRSLSTNPLVFGTNNAERMRIDASGNVGIGTSSPTVKLTTSTARSATLTSAIFGTSGTGAVNDFNKLTLQVQNTLGGSTGGAAIGAVLEASASNQTALAFYTDGGSGSQTERARIDSSGNLLVGTTSTTKNARLNQKLAVVSTGGTFGGASLTSYAGTGAGTRNLFDMNRSKGTTDGEMTAVSLNDFLGSMLFRGADGANFLDSSMISGEVDGTVSTGNMPGRLSFHTAGATGGVTERMRLDSSGNLLVGTTSNGGTNAKFEVDYTGSFGAALVNTSDTSGTEFLKFYNSTFGPCGLISRVGTTNAVVYNSTSDYRLKTVIGPVANAGQRIDALEPIEYEWKADGSRTRGFLAHQFQEVYAGSVSGTKDAVDAEGKPVYQSMQASSSEVIADLVAEIQSLRQRLAAAGI